MKKHYARKRVVGDHGYCVRVNDGPTRPMDFRGQVVLTHTYRCPKCTESGFRTDLAARPCIVASKLYVVSAPCAVPQLSVVSEGAD